jgi:hypothetical protein
MLSHKLAVLTLISLLALSALAIYAQASVQCPRCHGTGQITSQTCLTCGGSGQTQPNITKIRFMVGGSPTQTNISEVYHNGESVDAYGVATATINTQQKILTQSSNRTLLKANSDTLIIINFNGLEDENYFTHQIELAAETITCPACNGTGAGLLVICPDCGGTGYISEAAVGGLDFGGVVAPVIGVVAVVAATGAGVVVLRKRRLTETKIRTFTESEFQRWVLGRLRGAGASVLDSRKGIDGFTGDGSAVAAKPSDDVSKIQSDGFLNSLMQIKSRQGIFVAFSFSKEASAAVIRGRINYHIDVKLVTVKELLANKEAVLL